MPNHEHHENHEYHEHEAGVRGGNSQALLPIAVLAAGVIIAAAIIFGPRLIGNQGNKGTQNQGQTQQGQTQQVNINNVKTAGEPFIGSPNAPVTIAYWSDFQCPFCDRFETETLPTIIKDYVDTGKVYFVFKNYPIFLDHPDAYHAAEAGECAAEQGKFWEMHDAMFKAQQ